MVNSILDFFERVVRRAHLHSDEEVRLSAAPHPFDERNIHSKLPAIVSDLFDDGYFAQSTFEAFKFVDHQVARIAKNHETGVKLMMQSLGGDYPQVQLSPMGTTSEKDEQKGFQFIFAGSILAIRNPRGHTHSISDSLEDCLDHLGLASLLLRRLEQAGYPIAP